PAAHHQARHELVARDAGVRGLAGRSRPATSRSRGSAADGVSGLSQPAADWSQWRSANGVPGRRDARSTARTRGKGDAIMTGSARWAASHLRCAVAALALLAFAATANAGDGV